MRERGAPDTSHGTRGDYSRIRDDEYEGKEVEREGTKKYRQLVGELIAQGGVMHDDVNDIYRTVHDDVIVRRDSPEVIGSSVGKGKDLVLALDEKLGAPYANAVVWSSRHGSRGLENAFLEGHAHADGLVTVVGFTPEHIVVQTVPNVAQAFTSIDRTLVRSATGNVTPDDVRFVLFRLPIDRFPVEEMTEAEYQRYEEWNEEGGRRDPIFIFRGMTFENRQKVAA
ncbi:MAG: hypothetical protein NUV56_04200 [Candidatus Uhrbacteria bacterium]|nr:hypothetical protein [Candidatus Uhrbacteria bacterium]